MSARIAPEAIATVVPVAEYRLPAVPVRKVEPLAGAEVQIRKNPYMEAAKVSGAVSGEFDGTVEASSPEPVVVEPPAEPSGAAYVRAVISGALSPRPTTAQELFTRVGTGWVPPESEYRLADKTA
jgi:hypothetical protein